MRIQSFRDLDVWQRGMSLVDAVYTCTRGFPRDELFGLTSQSRRAAVSIPSNVAEGFNRHTTAAYTNHLSIALGSAGELLTLLEIAARQQFLPRAESDRLQTVVSELARMLQALMNALERAKARRQSTI